MRKTHKQIEFAVDDCGGNQRIFKQFDKAAGFAISVAASGKENVCIDVLIYSESGARAWGGDEAVVIYRDDPDASVHERIEISVNCAGKVA